MDQTTPIERVLALARERGLHDAAFARLVEETPQTIRNWKVRGLPANKVRKVALALGVTTDYILTGRGQPASENEVALPLLDARPGAGAGQQRLGEDAVVGRLPLAIPWVRRHLPSATSIANLCCVTAIGDSMMPTFASGDILIVDRGVTSLTFDAVYVLAKGDELFVKRVQRMLDGSLAIRSDNPNYATQTIQNPVRERINVIGRVLWAWAGRPL